MSTTSSGRRRTPFLAALGAAALATGCAGESAKPQPCTATEECPTGARCVQQVCVANAAPIAIITPPAAALEANALLTFDGSESHDPDAPGDSIVSHTWTFSALDAPCAPPVVAGTGPRAVVRFACAGRYEVSLVVADELSVASAPARRELAIVPRVSAPLVSAVPDVALGHRCAGDPLRCTPDADVTLGATVSGASGPVAYRWSVIARPDRPLGAERRVTFVPGADDPAPAVLLETDATAISGEWVFVVEASDAGGSLGTAVTRVSVGNSAPTVAALVHDFPHRYDADAAQFAVSDALEVSVVDPDGDPVPERAVTFRHVGDGGALFSGEDLGDRIAFNVIVPRSLGATYLIGAPELSRTIELTVRDVNGAPASAVWSVVVGNRPPVFAGESAVSVDHAYDPVALRYVASATLSTWSDPDGDPLEQAEPTGDPACATLRVEAGRATVDCALDFMGVAAAGNFAGVHDVSQRVRDPWVASSATSRGALTILNRPPRIGLNPPVEMQAACTATGNCCLRESVAPHACLEYDASFAQTTLALAGRFFDEDGDPLLLTAVPPPAIGVALPPACVPESCTVGVTLRPEVACGETAVDELLLTASDGDLASSERIPLSRVCVAP